MTRRGKAVLSILAAGAAAAAALRLALPVYLTRKVNERLARLEHYVGHVDSVSLRPWSATLRFEKLTLVVRGAKSDVPLVYVPVIDARYSWKALLHEGFVGDVALRRPVVHYIKPSRKKPDAKPLPRPKEAARIAKKSAEHAHAQRTAYVRRLDVVGGRLVWEDPEIRPGYVVELSSLDAVAYNIGTKPGLTEQTTRAEMTGGATGGGRLRFRIEADALAAKPTFQYSLAITSVSLPALNEWLRKRLDVEARDGALNFYSEAKAVNGTVHGYVKPLVVGLHEVRVRGGKSIPKQIKGELEKIATKIFRNPRKDQFGTQIEFSGDLDDPKTHPFQALVFLVRNAFVKALKPGLKGRVDLDKL